MAKGPLRESLDKGAHQCKGFFVVPFLNGSLGIKRSLHWTFLLLHSHARCIPVRKHSTHSPRRKSPYCFYY